MTASRPLDLDSSRLHSSKMNVYFRGYVLWVAAALICAVAVLGITHAGATARVRNIVGAVLLGLLIVSALYRVIRAAGGKQSRVVEHGPEMSSLAFPPSSLRK